METETEYDIVAECVSAINASVSADATLADAIKVAGDALNDAALLTWQAIDAGHKATAIASRTLGTNKDTVARLAIVGQFLSLDGTYNGPTAVDAGASSVGAISLAHYVRSVVVKLIKAHVSVKLIRGAIVENRKVAMANLKSLGETTATDESDGADDDATDGDDATTLDDFNAACAAAVQAITSAINAAPVVANDDDRHAVSAIADALALLTNHVAERAAVNA